MGDMISNRGAPASSGNLGDILERVLDKGIVIAGDIKIQIANIDLITIKIRLLITSVDRALEMGVNWWQNDAHLSSQAKEKELMQKNAELVDQVEKLKASINPKTILDKANQVFYDDKFLS
jgi:hypothetical protein